MSLPIDSISLDEYESLAKGNQGFMKVLLEKVIRQISEYQPKIIESIASRNLHQLREDSHYIKPMLASLKMNTLLDVLEQIKVALDQNNIDQVDLDQKVIFIESSFKHIITILRQKLDG